MALSQRFARWILNQAIKGDDNKLNRAIFSALGWKSPIFHDANDAAYIDKGYTYNADVYSIISMITRNCKSIEWKLYEVTDKKALKSFKGMTIGTTKDLFDARVMQVKAMQEIEEHEILDVLYQPNEMQGWTDLIESLMGYKKLTGNTYLYGLMPDVGNNKGLVKRIYVLPAQAVDIVYSGQWRDPIGGYEIDIATAKGNFTPQEICHIKEWNPNYLLGEGLYGQSPLQAAMRTVTSSNEADTARVASFQNHGAMGILSSAAGDIDKRMSNDEAESISDTYKAKFGGSANFGKILFTAAAVNWQAMGLSPVDMDILNSKKFDLRTLCNIYGLQSQLLNDPDNKTYNNQMAAKKSLYTDVIIPEINQVRDALNRWKAFIPAYSLRDNREYYLAPDYSSIRVLQDDMAQQVTWVTSLVNSGVISRNEARLLLNYDRSEQLGADDLTTGIAQLYKVGEYPPVEVNPENEIIQSEPE